VPIINKIDYWRRDLKKTAIILLTSILMLNYTEAANSGINDTPLLDYTVQNNNLPYGDYVLIRSWRNVTQLLISKDYNILLLYTDRNNRKDSAVTANGFSRVNSVILDVPPLRQSEFNHIIETFLVQGDSREFSDRKFKGLDYFITNTGEKFIRYSRENTVHKIRTINDGNEIVSSVNFDSFWKSLSIRDKSMGADGNLHHILITNSYDKNIKKILIKYASLLSEKLKNRGDN
jgi:hypothetical protein